MWVSERTLNDVIEKWLTPHEFLVDTPDYPTNPVPGRVASDCSEQANTLVSVLRAIGVSPDKVRVVLGEVNFDGNIVDMLGFRFMKMNLMILIKI